MNLKEILAKAAADLTAEEKTFLQENVAELSTEDRAKFADALAVEEIDMAKAMELVSKKFESIAEGMFGKITGKFLDGVEEQRKLVLSGKSVGKNEKADETTRAFIKAILNGDMKAAKALTTSTTGSSPNDGDAGLMIPTELRTEVLRIIPLYGIARRDMFYLPFSGPGNSRTIPALGTSVSVYWTNEGAAKRSTQPKFTVVTQTLKKLAAIVPFTEEILEDSAINLTALIAQLFAEAVGVEEDVQFFAGTGSPWTGVLRNSNVNIVLQASGDVHQLTADDLLDMQDATPSGALNGSKYYFHRSVLSVIRKLKDANGNYIYQAPANGLPGTIWNFPYETSDAFPAVSTVTTNTPYVLFGNLQRAAILGDKQQLQVKLLTEATITDTDGSTQINLAEQDMQALRVVERVGYVLALPKAMTVLKAQAHES